MFGGDTTETETGRDDYNGEDVDWNTGDCDDEMDETAYTVATPTPDLKCRHRQVAVLKMHVSFWLVSRVPEAIFLLLALVPLTAWLSHPLIENLQSLVAKAGRVRGKDKSSSQEGGKPTSLSTPGIVPKTADLTF